MIRQSLRLRLSLLIAFGLLLCSSPGIAECCQLPEGWQQLDAEETDGADKTPVIKAAAFDLDESSIPLGQPFTFNLQLCPRDDTEIERVTATAIMPAHLHGMNYTPEVTKNTNDPGYQVAGFLFHMPGIWKITVSVYSRQQAEHFSTAVTLK